MTEALDLMESYLQEERPHLVVTVGPEMIMRAQEDEAFKRLINGADLVVPDGTGVLWAAARCGIEVPERIAAHKSPYFSICAKTSSARAQARSGSAASALGALGSPAMRAHSRSVIWAGSLPR